VRWIEPDAPSPKPPLDVELALLRQATDCPDPKPLFLRNLADALFEKRDYRGALKAIDRYLERRPDDRGGWAFGARAHLARGDYENAIAASFRAGDAIPGVVVRCQALKALGRDGEAEPELRALLGRASHGYAFETLARMMAGRGEGTALLALCDAHIDSFACRSLAIGFRALALSLLGGSDEARRYVDLDRHVKRVGFDPPPAFGTLDRFNTALAAEILRDSSPDARAGFAINHRPDAERRPHLAPLYDFIRREMEVYIGEFPARGLDTILPERPAAARLFTFNIVMRGDGHNGAHVHRRALVSAVYHVQVPAEVSVATDRRGRLALGWCGDIAGGHMPCWGVRHVMPEPGVLTLFPSYFFHDVVPTRTDSPRVAVAADLTPVAS
jgi:hypothetical protein